MISMMLEKVMEGCSLTELRNVGELKKLMK